MPWAVAVGTQQEFAAMMDSVRADASGHRTNYVNDRHKSGEAVWKGRDSAVAESNENGLHDLGTENLGIDTAYRIVKDILDQITLHDSPPINDEVANTADSHRRRSPTSNTSTASVSTASHTVATTGHNRDITDMGSPGRRYSRQQHVLPGDPTSPPASPTGSPNGPASVVSLEAASTLSSVPSAEFTSKFGNDTASLWMAQYQRSQTRAEMKMGNVALATLCIRTLDSIDASKILPPEDFAPPAKPQPLPAKVHPSPKIALKPFETKSPMANHSPSKLQLRIVTVTDELQSGTPSRAQKSPIKKDPPTDSPSPDEKKMWLWRKQRSPDGKSKAPSPPGVIAANRAGWQFDAKDDFLDDQPPTPVRGNTRRDPPTTNDRTPTRGAVHTVGSADSTDAVYTRDEFDNDDKAARSPSKVHVGDGIALSLDMQEHDDLLELEDEHNHGEFNPASTDDMDMEDITEETEDDIAEEQGVKVRSNSENRLQDLPRRNVNADLDEMNGRYAASQALSPRFQMFGSEYARFLSTSPLAPVTRPTKRKSGMKSSPAARTASGVAKRSPNGSRPLNIEDANNAALTGAITDIIITHGLQLPPKGYFRISQTGEGDQFTALRRNATHGGVSGLIPGRRSTQVFINVKKEPNWDRAAQRPCVTALAVIFPDKKEFVPPGFSVVRRYKNQSPTGTDKALTNSSGPSAAAADLNFGSTGERVFLCYRRSREGNPITGIFPLQPLNNETVPEGYTVIERTPRNHVADINTGAGAPVFLAFRQRLASLETLRPLPLVLSVHSANPFDHNDGPSHAHVSLQRRMRRSSKKKRLRAYYCTGGTIVASEVGRFHIMDRSTHSLLSPSSISHRLSLIEASRHRDVNSGGELQIKRAPTYASSAAGSVSGLGVRGPYDDLVSCATSAGFSFVDASMVSEFSLDDTSSTGRSFSSYSSLDQSIGSLSVGSHHGGDDCSRGSNPSSVASARFSSSAANVVNQTLFSSNDVELQRCLDVLDFIPAIETVSDPRSNDDIQQRKLQARVAALTPILTSCYTHHGGTALIAVEGLTNLLTTTDFFSPDVGSVSDAASGRNSRLTLLDLATQAVCDVATCTSRETSFGSCVDFVQHAVEYSGGQLNPRTIGYILRFYFFVFYFGASVPTSSKGPNPVWTSGSREQRESSAERSIVALHDLPLLYEEPLSPGKKRYLSGGAPQAAALALKELISLTIGRLSLVSSADIESFGRDVEAVTSSEPFGTFIQGVVSTLIDGAAYRVDMANYTQLALHQVSRSGGSELFWSDMLNSCGAGLFSTAAGLSDELKSGYMVSFALLANLIKVSSGKIRHIPLTDELVPRDVASKLLSLELLHHFVVQWQDDQKDMGGSVGLSSAGTFPAVETMAFSIRRLVVPCLLSNTESCLEDGRVFRRIMRIVSELWRSPYYRRHMKMEIGVLVNHFALRILQLGPQIFSPGIMGALENSKASNNAAPSSPQTQSKFPLLLQQIDLLFEVRRWFNSNSSDSVEFFLNFDTDMSSHESVMSQMLPGTQWRLCQHLCGAICTIAEQSGDLLCKQIRASRMSNTVPPPSPTAATAAVFFSSQTSLEGSTEDAEKMMREGSRHLQQTAFDALTQILKSLAHSAATATGKQFPRLLSSWEGEGGIDSLDHSSGSFDLTVSTPPPVGVGVAGNPSPRSNKTRKAHTSKREEASRQDNDDGIVGYWQSAIAAERRKAGPSPKRPARKHVTSLPSRSYCGDGKNSGSRADVEPVKSAEPVATNGDQSAHNTLPITEDVLPVAFEIARTKSLKKAVDYLIACDFLTPSPRDVASFLRLHRTQLDPSSLGVFLAEVGSGGGDVEYWNQIRFNYFRSISFVGMNVEQGLRHFLTNCGFLLPGEAQQIDRIMTTFAQCYWEDNAGDLGRCPFRDQDTVFLIAFAIIMLNTDLHKSHGQSSNSRKQRKRMTKQEFLNNLRGVNNNEDISRDYLEEVYDSIEAHPITLLMTTDHASAVTGSIGLSSHEASVEMMSLEMHLLEALKNAKMSEELLRGVSVHEHPFYTVDDYSRYLGYEGYQDALADVARSVVSTTWHHFHGLIHSVLDAAHLDPRGMEMSLDLLQYALCTTICLDMTMERAAFVTQLARFKMFRERRGSRFSSAQEHQAYKSEDWYVKLESNCADPADDKAKLLALTDVHGMIEELHDSLRVNVKAKREMNCVVRRIRQGEFLLNDPTRFFLREGDLVKRSSRMGRSTKYHFFLFSDVMIYAKAASSQADFKIHEELPLHLMKITDWFPDKRQQMKTAFQVHHPRKSFIVFADSVEERQSWVKDIREAIVSEVERLTHLENARLAAASVER